MSESSVSGEQALTTPPPVVDDATRAVIRALLHLRCHAQQSLLIATLAASLSCLPGCATPLQPFWQQPSAAVEKETQRQYGLRQASIQRQQPSPPAVPKAQAALSPATE